MNKKETEFWKEVFISLVDLGLNMHEAEANADIAVFCLRRASKKKIRKV